ncbi:PREDICTED: uncharacterized protein LOC104765989 [Camelina sativa]|uniref:Uncharacterized protein LOC104765989 n=1 Tax=Camelina sativa TaxID=90675 RepID=A0ABM0XMF3_CAMSA|nr:PREDICTED: uncharacterized protein LOC104765989 [Camelina sativa]
MATAKPQQQDAVSDDFDYEIWDPTTKATLIDQGLWDVVENGVPPDPSKILESAAKIKPEELSQWRDLVVKDTKALQILQSSLTESIFRKTLSASSAKDVWDLLRKGNEQATIRRLEKQFEEAKKGEKESFDSFLDRVLGITDQLRVLRIEKSDYEICKKVFASLPESCDGVHSMLEEIMNVHHVSAASLVRYFYVNGYKFDSVNEEILLVILKNLRLRPESEKWCGVCFKIDHNEEDCNRLLVKRYEEEEGSYVEAEYRLSTPVSFSEKTYEEDIWVAYVGATSHMTPHEKYFTTLDRTHKAEVGLVDGTLLKVEGKGSVQIRMKGGKKKSIKNVIFVPGLNRNVLSIEKMVSRRYSFSQVREDEWIICDRTGLEFADTVLSSDDNGFVMRLKVVEGNLTS